MVGRINNFFELCAKQLFAIHRNTFFSLLAHIVALFIFAGCVAQNKDYPSNKNNEQENGVTSTLPVELKQEPNLTQIIHQANLKGDVESIALAETKLINSLKNNPNNIEAHHMLSMFYLGPYKHICRSTMLDEKCVAQRVKDLELAMNAVELDPLNPMSLRVLGRVYFQSYDYEKAAEYFRLSLKSALEKENISVTFRSREWLGKAYMLLGQYDMAENTLKKSVAEMEKSASLKKGYAGCPFQALGDLYFRMKQPEQRKNNYIKAADYEPENLVIQFEASRVSLENKDYSNALKYIDKAIALSERPELLRKHKLFKEQIFTQQTKPPITGKVNNRTRSEKDSTAFFQKAFNSFARGNIIDAKDNLQKSSRLDRPAQYLTVRGYIFIFEKSYRKAHESFLEALAIVPGEPGALVGLGHVAISRNEYEQAEIRLGQVLSHPDIKTHSVKSRSSLNIDYSEIVSDMAQLGLGWIFARQTEYNKAIGHFQIVFDRRPNNIPVALALGIAFSRMHRNLEATRIFNRVLVLAPGNAQALAELGLVKLNEGEFEEAESYFSLAIEKDKDDYTCPYEGLGLLYLRQGQMGKAKTNFERAISINPDIDFEKYNGLANIHIQAGNYKMARDLLNKSIQNFPHDNEAKDLLATIKGNGIN
jgi:tetratricopeptide (TPR) repeat protein